MFRTLVCATMIGAASFAFVAVAQAEDIPATPMNHGAPPPGSGFMVPQPAAAPMAEPQMERPMMHKRHMMKHSMSRKI